MGRVVWIQGWVCLAAAYATLTLGILLLFYVKPEARHEVRSLAQVVLYVLLGGGAALVLTTVVYFMWALVLGIKDRRESRSSADQSLHATTAPGSPDTQAGDSQNASPANANVLTSASRARLVMDAGVAFLAWALLVFWGRPARQRRSQRPDDQQHRASGSEPISSPAK
jgi:hypothetical protein